MARSSGKSAPRQNRPQNAKGKWPALFISAAAHLFMIFWLQWSAAPIEYARADISDPVDTLLLAPPPPEDLPPVPLADHLSSLLSDLPDELAEVPELEELSNSEVEGFKVQMSKCWSVPIGAANAHKLIIAVRVALSPEGRLLTRPEIVNDPGTRNPFFRTAAESALRAIRRCQPFRMPEEKYESWKNMTLVFNPAEMVDG